MIALIGTVTGIKTTAALYRQCRIWVIFRPRRGLERFPLYTDERTSPSASARSKSANSDIARWFDMKEAAY
jgi:hypothetical protein